MAENTLLHFDNLNLRFGQTIQLLPDPVDSSKRYDVVLLGCLPGETVMVIPPEEGEFPSLQQGQRVVIRITTINGVAMFPTVILHIAEMPLYTFYLDFPKAIKFKQIRNAARVDVSLPVLVTNITQPNFGTIAGRSLDISLGGAKLIFDHDVGAVGDNIELKSKFEIANIKRVLAVTAQIRTRKQSRGGYEYGIQFFEQDEDKQLVLFGFIYSSLAMGTAKNID